MRPHDATTRLRPRAPLHATLPPNGEGIYVAIGEAIAVDVEARRLDVLRFERRTVPLAGPLRQRRAAPAMSAPAPRSRVRLAASSAQLPVTRQLVQDAAGTIWAIPVSSPVPAQPAALRRGIPARYSHRAVYRRSRAEVLHDMRAVLGTLPVLSSSPVVRGLVAGLRWAKAALIGLVSRRRLLEWRRLLEGKRLDDQLWAVRPPAGFGHLAEVREWIRARLARAGYDPDPMLVEWEIHWRRRR